MTKDFIFTFLCCRSCFTGLLLLLQSFLLKELVLKKTEHEEKRSFWRIIESNKSSRLGTKCVLDVTATFKLAHHKKNTVSQTLTLHVCTELQLLKLIAIFHITMLVIVQVTSLGSDPEVALQSFSKNMLSFFLTDLLKMFWNTWVLRNKA